MKVAIFVGNPQGIYSGGRYLSLILAYSLARAGVGVTYVTDNLPMFDADFAPYEGRFPVTKIVDPAFEAPDLGGSLDWVIVIPSGGITHVVYDAAIACAERTSARVALLSFETPNWFNALSPYKRNPLAWESWRAALVRGGLVVTIARAGIEPAERFYAATEHGAPLLFGHWHPPLNDLVADAQPAATEREKVVIFMRTQDAHKGAMDLLRLDPTCLAGRTLAVVFGRPAEAEYLAALQRHFSGAGVRVELRERISDAEKFALLAAARLLLFPSYFEGFGYPVVEAAHMGVPSVAYDLPVLRETVGGAASYVPAGDTAAFSAAVSQALLREPGTAVRAALRIRPDTLSAGERARDLLANSMGKVRPVALVAVPKARKPAPVAALLDDPRLQAAWDLARRPGVLAGLRATLSPGMVTVSGRIASSAEDAVLQVDLPGASIPALRLRDLPPAGPAETGARAFEIIGSLSPADAALPSECRVVLSEGGARVATGLARVQARAEILLEARCWRGEARAGNPAPHGSAVLVADLRRLLGGSPEALALSELATLFRRDGRETIMLLRSAGTAVALDEIETDLLPLVDAVERVDADFDIRARLDRLPGPVVVAAPDDLFPLPEGECALRVDLGSTSIRIGESGATREAERVAHRTLPLSVSRSEMLRSGRRLLVVGGADARAFADLVAYVLPEVSRRIGPVRVALHRPFAARIGTPALRRADSLGPGWTIGSEDLRGLVSLAREAGRAVVLDLGPDATGAMSALADIAALPLLSLPHAEVLGPAEPRSAPTGGASFEAPLRGAPQDEADGSFRSGSREEECGALGTGRADALVRSLAEALAEPLPEETDLSAALRRLWPSPAPTALPPFADAAQRLAARWGPAPPPRPPTLLFGEAASFSAPSRRADGHLVAGWPELTGHGCEMPQEGALFAFFAPELPDCEMTLSVLARSRLEHGNLGFELWLNGRRLGRGELAEPGLAVLDFTVPEAAWRRDGVQTLAFRGEMRKVGGRQERPILAGLAFTPPQASFDWTKVDADRELPRQGGTVPGLPRRLGFGRGSPDLPSLTLGWSHPEPTGTWSSASVAGLFLQTEGEMPLRLTVRGRTLVIPSHAEQRVFVDTPAGTLGEFRLRTTDPVALAVAVPPEVTAAGIDVLQLRLPDAASPLSLGLSADGRQLGLFLEEIALDAPARDAIAGKRRPGEDPDAAAFAFGRVHAAGALLRATGSGAPPTLVLDWSGGESRYEARPDGDGWELWCALGDLAQPPAARLESEAGESARVAAVELWPMPAGTEPPVDFAFVMRGPGLRDRIAKEASSWNLMRLIGRSDGRG